MIYRRIMGIGCSVVIGATVASAAGPCQAVVSVKPDPITQWGVWQGWGISLCWWAKASGNQDDLADIFFTSKTTTRNGQALPGLGFNIVRYNAGASSAGQVDGTTMVASPKISDRRQIDGFWLNPESSDPKSSSWDWTVDANQRAMLRKAKERGANLFELFSNSPMWWMCKNHNPSGDDDANHDNLAPEHYRDHAVYLATIAKVASDQWGIDFTSVEPFNEPMAPYWHSSGTQEGCHFSVASQQAVIADLREELDKRGMASTIISASDETAYDQATSTWSGFDTATKGKVGRVNVHGYQANGDRSALNMVVAGKELWNSEYGEDDGSGLSLAKNLTLDIRELHPTGWCYWQGIDGGGWGLIPSRWRRRPTQGATVNPNTPPPDESAPPVNPKYFVLAQYTRHIRPGMQIIDAGDGSTVAAYEAKNHELVIVTVNAGPAQTFRYDLSGFKKAGGPVSTWTTDTAGDQLYVSSDDVRIVGNQFSSDLGANSVRTFEIEDVRR